MDEFNIADISSAINSIGGDKDFDILGALQHRAPVFSALSPLISSQSENNTNQENLKNMQDMRSQEKNVRFNLDKNTHNSQKSIINKPVDPSGSVSSSDNSSKLDDYDIAPKSKNICTSNQKQSDKDTSNHLTSIFGYNIPISTLYFILVLVAITILLYLLTAEKKKDKDRDKEKERN